MFRVGSKVRIVSDNENYDRFRNRVLKITHIAKNRDEHQGYDEGLSPMALFDLETLSGEPVPFSLYEYEVENA